MAGLSVRIVVADGDSSVLLPDQGWKLAAGDRLIVAGDAVADVTGNARILRRDVMAPVRLLAFMDHGFGTEHPGGRRSVSCARCSVNIEQQEVMLQWLTDLRVNEDRSANDLLSFWSATEQYQLVRFVLAEFGSGKSVADLAARYGLSPAQFRRRCKEGLGRPVKMELRLLRARQSLLDYSGRHQTMTRVAADNGYASLSHFCSDIKSLLGMGPREVFQAVQRS